LKTTYSIILIFILFPFKIYSQEIRELEHFILRNDYNNLNKYLAQKGFDIIKINNDFDLSDKHIFFRGEYQKIFENEIRPESEKISIEYFESYDHSNIDVGKVEGITINKKYKVFNPNDNPKKVNKNRFVDFPLDEFMISVILERSQTNTELHYLLLKENKVNFDYKEYNKTKNNFLEYKIIPDSVIWNYFKSHNLIDSSFTLFLSTTDYTKSLIGNYKNHYHTSVLITSNYWPFAQKFKNNFNFHNYEEINYSCEFERFYNPDASSNEPIHSIDLIKVNNIFKLNLTVGNKKKLYILDSGASDMTIDNETYLNLLENGIINSENKLPDAEYILADGSKYLSKRIIIPSINLDGIVIKNITASIVNNNSPLLLGKSVLNKLKSWKIDNESNKLIVEIK